MLSYFSFIKNLKKHIGSILLSFFSKPVMKVTMKDTVYLASLEDVLFAEWTKTHSLLVHKGLWSLTNLCVSFSPLKKTIYFKMGLILLNYFLINYILKY